MNTHDQLEQTSTDPLGLSDLELIEPGYDGWSNIESALQAGTNSKRNWRRTGGWLAMAASLALVVSITMRNAEIIPITPDVATVGPDFASVSVQENIRALIGLSQKMEQQVKHMRQETISMPAESAIYIAELEDLIAQVDNELSFDPNEIDLWGQRLNLLLDLAQIYQQQRHVDYGSMAAL